MLGHRFPQVIRIVAWLLIRPGAVGETVEGNISRVLVSVRITDGTMCMCVCVCVCVCVLKYIYIYMYAHMCTYAHATK